MLNLKICQPCTEEPAKTFIIFERLITESFWFEFDFIDQLVEIDPLYH